MSYNPRPFKETSVSCPAAFLGHNEKVKAKALQQVLEKSKLNEKLIWCKAYFETRV